MQIHRSARKHGIDDDTIAHAVEHAIVVVDLEPDADPPRVLAIGTDRAGNLLEIIWLHFEDGPPIVITPWRYAAPSTPCSRPERSTHEHTEDAQDAGRPRAHRR